MDAVSAGLAALLCTTSAADLPPAVARWEPFIAESATRFSVPESWIARVMLQESGGQTTFNGRPITSSAGAMGLMQIMPGTYTGLRLRYGFGADAYDPHDNIAAGAAYLRELYLRYGYPNLFAAYHAGPSRLEAFLAGKRALPSITTAYVTRLTSAESLPPLSSTSVAARPSGPAGSALFFINRAAQSPSPTAMPSTSLFVPLTTQLR